MVILFDLDGTLTDSGEGITKCAQLALEHFGIRVEDRQSATHLCGAASAGELSQIRRPGGSGGGGGSDFSEPLSDGGEI